MIWLATRLPKLPFPRGYIAAWQRTKKARTGQKTKHKKIPHPLSGTPVANVKVTGCPFNVIQTVNGSFPICSVVAPLGVLVSVPGTVTGIGAEHVFPFPQERVTAVIFPDVIVWLRLGTHVSRAMRWAKEVANYD